MASGSSGPTAHPVEQHQLRQRPPTGRQCKNPGSCGLDHAGTRRVAPDEANGTEKAKPHLLTKQPQVPCAPRRGPEWDEICGEIMEKLKVDGSACTPRST